MLLRLLLILFLFSPSVVAGMAVVNIWSDVSSRSDVYVRTVADKSALFSEKKAREEMSDLLESVDVTQISQVTNLSPKLVKPLSGVVSNKTDVIGGVPFYSQFTDISDPQWQKVGCGIASLAMIISYYENEKVSVDDLLNRGVKAGAFLPSAGWIHSGLVALSQKYGLDGSSESLANYSMAEAFTRLEAELANGPVMASVHYTFEPTNPIPHLVVVDGVRDGQVIYNDPAESGAGGSISVEKFKSAWKKRYIVIRPV